jgi:hypothetical protein
MKSSQSRLLRQLGLVFIVIFLFLGVVGCVRVSGRGHRKRVARGIVGCGFVSGSCARWIGRRSFVGETGDRQTTQYHGCKKQCAEPEQTPTRPRRDVRRQGSVFWYDHFFLLKVFPQPAQTLRCC